MRSAWRWVMGGIGAAALAVGAGEVVGGFLGGPSLVAAIGGVVIELQPPGAKDLMVALFGEADKLILEVATTLAALAIGGLLGLAARRDLRIAIAGFVAFGLVAVWA